MLWRGLPRAALARIFSMRSNVASCAARGRTIPGASSPSRVSTTVTACRPKPAYRRERGDWRNADLFRRRDREDRPPCSGQPPDLLLETRGIRIPDIPRGTSTRVAPRGAFGYHPHDLRLSHPARRITIVYPRHILARQFAPCCAGWLLTVTPPTNHRLQPRHRVRGPCVRLKFDPSNRRTIASGGEFMGNGQTRRPARRSPAAAERST